MFRHQGAILREFSNYEGSKVLQSSWCRNMQELALDKIVFHDLRFPVFYLVHFIG